MKKKQLRLENEQLKEKLDAAQKVIDELQTVNARRLEENDNLHRMLIKATTEAEAESKYCTGCVYVGKVQTCRGCIRWPKVIDKYTAE